MWPAPELAAAPKLRRYDILALLGRGSTSIVYKAFDREKNFVVALKSLKFPEHDDVYDIKQEFRFFRDLYHPNLVNLYDLYVTDDTCFYTMEFVDGLDFASFARPLVQNTSKDHEALRTALGQLVEGLSVLHDVGRLHRDLKPSNILVERNLRTVLLDFGLATEAKPGGLSVTLSKLYAGTPAYMAPEQLAGGLASRATDLYSLGIVLYEALCGHRPYPDGSPIARYDAQKALPAAPRALCPDVPADLSDLTLGLLSFDPGDRPSLAEVQGIVCASSMTRPRVSLPAHPDVAKQRFVGRETELAQLESALEHAIAGESIVVQVSGVSGVGKTTLVERFLAEARERHGALVLRSRCHHQEAVRFNAIDGLVDALSHYLLPLDEARLSELVPEELPALITMFPVLGRVPFPQCDVDRATGEPQEIVRRAFGALRTLLRGLANQTPVILWVDDLQWGDASSVPLLCEIARSGGDKPILPLFSYRTEDLRDDSVAATLKKEIAADQALRVHDIAVRPLEPGAVEALVRRLEGEAIEIDPAWIAEVSRESAGLPFFVLELVAHGRRHPGQELSAAEVLEERVHTLGDAQRTVLEIVSVAGTLPEKLLVRAAAQEGASGQEIYQLLNQHLLRKGDLDSLPVLETYHDRIRVAVLASLGPTIRRRRHLQIATEMAKDPEPNQALLVEHYQGAGALDRAAEHAVLAGRNAVHRLAFANAIDFFSLALRLRDGRVDNGTLTVELATTLADAGRSAEAGEHFLNAARLFESAGKDPLAIVSCESRAAQQLTISGRLNAGLNVYRKVFAHLHLPFPPTPRAAQRMSIVNRLVYTFGAYRLRLKPKRELADQDLMRVDALWAAAKGLLMLDYVVGDAMLSWYLRRAAGLGEPSRLMRALAMECAVLANIGRRWSLKRGAVLFQEAKRLSQGSADPYDRMLLKTTEASISWFSGRWQDAADFAQEVVDLHHTECLRYDFDFAISLSFRTSALVMLGAIQQARSETLKAIEDALQRGDIYISRLFKSGYWVYIALASDDPESVMADSDDLLEGAPNDRFTLLHWSYFNARVNALVYAGRGWEAWALVQQHWPLIRTTGLLHFACLNVHVREIRSRAALKAAASGPPPKTLEHWSRERLLKVAADDAKKIARMRTVSHADASAAAVQSGIAALRGDIVGRRDALHRAALGFERAGMTLHRAAADLQRQNFFDGAEREHIASDALQVMSRECVKEPNKMARFLMCV